MDTIRSLKTVALLFSAVIALTACGGTAKIPTSESYGANPTLPAPEPSLLPTVNLAPAKGWSLGVKPVSAPGTEVTALARDLDHPRWIYVLPNGDVLVAETNARGNSKIEAALNLFGVIARK